MSSNVPPTEPTMGSMQKFDLVRLVHDPRNVRGVEITTRIGPQTIGTVMDFTEAVRLLEALQGALAFLDDAPAFDPEDPGAMLDTLKINKTKGRKVGGTWVTGTIGGHAFEALVFPEHAEVESYELDGSRISKLWLKDQATGAEVASFDRGWDVQPTTDAAKAIVGLLAAGLAEHIFGR